MVRPISTLQFEQHSKLWNPKFDLQTLQIHSGGSAVLERARKNHSNNVNLFTADSGRVERPQLHVFKVYRLNCLSVSVGSRQNFAQHSARSRIVRERSSSLDKRIHRNYELRTICLDVWISNFGSRFRRIPDSLLKALERMVSKETSRPLNTLDS